MIKGCFAHVKRRVVIGCLVVYCSLTDLHRIKFNGVESALCRSYFLLQNPNGIGMRDDTLSSIGKLTVRLSIILTTFPIELGIAHVNIYLFDCSLAQDNNLPDVFWC